MANRSCNENERLKRRYVQYARSAKRKSEKSLDRVVASIDRFQKLTHHKPFSAFHIEQVVAFREKLAEAVNSRTGQPLSATHQKAILADLKDFFLWLANEPGYRKRIRYAHCEYFNLDNSTRAIANASRPVVYPSVEQIEHVIRSLPGNTAIEKRNRALICFTILTGARVDATASARVGHVDPIEKVFSQDARTMRTKFSKTFQTWFFPVSELAETIFLDYLAWLTSEYLFGPGDPLFGKTETASINRRLQATGIKRQHWTTTQPIRNIFKAFFENAGIPYHHPHTFRHTLAAIGKKQCKTPAEIQAWAQNLGHEDASTMMTSYAKVDPEVQKEIIRRMGQS